MTELTFREMLSPRKRLAESKKKLRKRGKKKFNLKLRKMKRKESKSKVFSKAQMVRFKKLAKAKGRRK